MSMKEGKKSAVYTVNLPIQQFRGVTAYLTRVNTTYRLTHLYLYANGIYARDECHAINWVAWIKTFIFIRSVIIKEFKRGIRVSFDPYVNAMWRRPYCPSSVDRGELLYLRFWRNHSARSTHIIVTAWFTAPRDNFYACLMWAHTWKATHA